MDESVYGLTLGGGVELALIRNRLLKMDYAYKSMDKLGNFSMFTIGATL
jgi:opacity protein-like surface antigen